MKNINLIGILIIIIGLLALTGCTNRINSSESICEQRCIELFGGATSSMSGNNAKNTNSNIKGICRSFPGYEEELTTKKLVDFLGKCDTKETDMWCDCNINNKSLRDTLIKEGNLDAMNTQYTEELSKKKE